MSQFNICDWCGEPVDKPVETYFTGNTPRGFLLTRDAGHFHHSDERECWALFMRGLKAAYEDNAMAGDAGRGVRPPDAIAWRARAL
jgi:hypothetical protein